MLCTKYLITLFLFTCVFSTPKLVLAEGSIKQSYFGKAYLQDDSTKQKKDTASTSSPRDGKYLILSYGSNPANPLRLGYFTLGANEYKYYDLDNKVLGDGTYVYDVSERQIKWQSGPFRQIGWSGDFTIERNGKVHSIRLKNNTVGTNTIE